MSMQSVTWAAAMIVLACTACPPGAPSPDAGTSATPPSPDAPISTSDDASTPAPRDAATPAHVVPEILPFDFEPGRAMTACMQAEHVLLPRPPPPPGRRVPVPCMPGMTIEETPLESILRDGQRVVATYSMSGDRRIDVDADGVVDIAASGPIETSAQRISFSGCTPEQQQAISDAFFAAVGGGVTCLGRSSRSLAGDFVRTIRTAVFAFECTPLPGRRAADIGPARGPGCDANAASYPVRVDVEKIRGLGADILAQNLASVVFHEILHTFVPTLAAHNGGEPVAIDRVYACQTACFPTANWPAAEESKSCCFNPGLQCAQLGIIGTAHWTRYWSTVVASTSRGCGDVERRGTSKGWESSGCKWDFIRDTDGALVVEVSCQFHTGAETEGQRDVPCYERTEAPCERWTDATSEVASASCQERFPVRFDRWPRVDLPLCTPADGRAEMVDRSRPRTCGPSSHTTVRRCEPRQRVGSTPRTHIDVELDGLIGTKRTTPLPCPVGSACEDLEKVTWDFSQLPL